MEPITEQDCLHVLQDSHSFEVKLEDVKKYVFFFCFNVFKIIKMQFVGNFLMLFLIGIQIHSSLDISTLKNTNQRVTTLLQ